MATHTVYSNQIVFSLKLKLNHALHPPACSTLALHVQYLTTKSHSVGEKNCSVAGYPSYRCQGGCLHVGSTAHHAFLL